MRANVRLPEKVRPEVLGKILCRVRIDGKTDCWTVPGRGGRRGVLRVKLGGESVLAHRVVYQWLVGPIGAGLVVDHLCGNGGCLNPLHMEPVTVRENTRRGRAGWKDRQKTHCGKGHPLSGQNLALVYDERGEVRRRVCRTCRALAQRAWYERHWRVGPARGGAEYIGGVDRIEA